MTHNGLDCNSTIDYIKVWLSNAWDYKTYMYDFPSPCVIEFSICELFIRQTYFDMKGKMMNLATLLHYNVRQNSITNFQIRLNRINPLCVRYQIKGENEGKSA